MLAGVRPWLAVAVASALAVLAWAGFWYLAVPRFDVCPAVHPAPAGCRVDARISAAWLWTTIVAVLYVAVVVAVRVRPGGGQYHRSVALGTVALGVAALYGLWSVWQAGG
ncbi:hypothetical protein SAMN05216284_104305 [Micromonospora sediminimaris]|uniref:Vitamin K epoxide reductase family protein n=1 Tax=Micromonospora sediminimaris TaxID=547162 RepID=A0A9W5ULG5_9ACTN|nr:hypothetical protein Vse01_04900 [Micromonospora sediminimaris]SFC43759.1 hypothetical protein SAMN05216284_104305 [Micromonospora sediminimaris]